MKKKKDGRMNTEAERKRRNKKERGTRTNGMRRAKIGEKKERKRKRYQTPGMML